MHKPLPLCNSTKNSKVKLSHPLNVRNQRAKIKNKHVTNQINLLKVKS